MSTSSVASQLPLMLELYAQGVGTQRIAEAIGVKSDRTVIYHLRKAGVQLRSRDETLRLKVGTPDPMPFRRECVVDFTTRAAAAQSMAMAWFQARGHQVSIPSNAGYCPYDLLVEAETRLYRIQVKYTGHRTEAGVFNVKVCRCESRQLKKVEYREDEVDWFFIVTEAGESYLIPRASLQGRQSLCLDRIWIDYRV